MLSKDEVIATAGTSLPRHVQSGELFFDGSPDPRYLVGGGDDVDHQQEYD
jgi:hypothetical protein